MSLIICRKQNDELLIVSDTRLTYPDDQFPNKRTGHPSDGLIKTLIVNPNLCISFAGEIDQAESGIKQIQSTNDLTSILEILKTKSSGSKTDFIVCTSTPSVEIFEIKNSHCVNVQNSWIGSSKAFNRFQGYFTNQIPAKEHRSSSFFKIEPTTSKPNSDLAKISGVFDLVISDPTVPEVDGFKVVVVLEDRKFKYRGYLHNYMGPIALKVNPKIPRQIIPFSHGTASDGSYMVNFFNSGNNFTNVALHILQGNMGIVYSRADNGLLRPQIFQMDEVDFVDFVEGKYGLGPTMVTMDKERKYFDKANAHFKNGDYVAAISLFEKIISIEKGKMKANAHYAKGICFLNLKKMQEGMLEIQKAINIDPKFQKEANKLFPQLKKFYRNH